MPREHSACDTPGLMAWVHAVLRGQKVLARARPDGALEVDGGRVEIRYKATDPRAYRASAQNLEVSPGPVLPEDTCVPAAPPDEAAGTAAKKTAGKAAKKTSSPARQVAAEWIAYTDGACSGNPGPAGSGMVVIAPGGKVHEGFEYLGVATNNVAELTAVLRGVESIPRDALSVAVMTDSKYAIGVLTQGWKAKANQELIHKTREVLHGRRIRLVYVPGHAGVPMNERADELAREAVRTEDSRPLPKL